jgi:hypothetical protein
LITVHAARCSAIRCLRQRAPVERVPISVGELRGPSAGVMALQGDCVSMPPHAGDDRSKPRPGVECTVQELEPRRAGRELEEAKRGGEEGAAAISPALTRTDSSGLVEASPSIHRPSMIAHEVEAARRRSRQALRRRPRGYSWSRKR